MYVHNISLLFSNYKRTFKKDNKLKIKMKRRAKATDLCKIRFYGWAFCAFTWAFFERKAGAIPKESDPKIR